MEQLLAGIDWGFEENQLVVVSADGQKVVAKRTKTLLAGLCEMRCSGWRNRRKPCT